MKFFINPYRKIKELQAKLHIMEDNIADRRRINKVLWIELTEARQSAAALQDALDKEKAKNAKWLELMLGYSPNEAILINKSLWGRNLKWRRWGMSEIAPLSHKG